MSSNGQILGAVVGGVAGFFLGGPGGALQGAAFGGGIGAALDPPKGPTIQGPRLSDLTVQTSTYGAFLPRFYGTAPAHGNVFWLEGGKLKEVVRKQKQGGKGGGGGSTTKTYTYYATFAIGLGEGPIAGVRRIWCRDKLIYNAGSDDLETIIASNQNAAGWRIYLGTDDQMPDPRIEAEKGIGNTPAYRGTAYIVFDDFELTNYNNSLEGAQFKFEVVSSQDSSVSLIGDENSGYTRNTTSQGLIAKPHYIDESRVVFHAPQWTTSWPSSGDIFTYEFHASGSVVFGSIPVTGMDVPISPPSGNTDDIDEFWANPRSVFQGTTSVFNGDSGYIQKIGGIYCGLSTTGGKKIYARREESSIYNTVTTTANTFCINSGLIYAISSDGISVYNTDLELIEFISVASPTLVFPTARCQEHNGSIRIYNGSDISPKIYDLNVTDFLYIEKYSIPIIVGDYYYSSSVYFYGDVFVRAYQLGVNNTMFVQWYNLEATSGNSALLSEIVVSESKISSIITQSDIDSSLLASYVRGYRVQGGTIRASLENLQRVFPFDVRQHGYQLQCVPRGGASVATIPHTDLGATAGDSLSDILRQSREMDSQLPASTHLKFWDADREYASGEEYADRPGTESVNRVDREIPIVLTATEAARAADVLQQLPWLERTAFELELPPTYGDLEPADVITVTTPGSTYLLRLTEINDSSDTVRKCKAKPAAATIYNSVAVGGGGNIPPQTIGLAGPSLFLPLDIPLVDEVSQTSPGFVGVMTGYNNSWPGAIAVRSADGGQTFEDIQAFVGKATVGVAQNSLAAHAGYLISSATLTLSVISGEFESITEEQLLTGYNYAAYGADGRWEIVRFRAATLNANGTYTLSGFVRGDKGTEWATGLHQVGDYFVLLDDPDNAFIGMSIQSIGLDRIYRGVTSGASLDDADDVTFSYVGVNLEPLSAVNVTGARDGSQNFTGSFYRRSRLSSAWWTNGVQAPVGETTEAYEIDVMNGSSVVRTISSSTTSFSYTAAQQTTDFGSAQASITFRIYQLSETVGRGYVREVTL
jgi:hypothetical protein